VSHGVNALRRTEPEKGTNGMKRRSPHTAAAAVAAVVLGTLTACSTGPTPTAPKVVNMDASWARYYRSMADLKAHTDVAVEGTITKATQEPGASTTSTPFTDFQFTVAATLYDPGHRAAATAGGPETLTIHQTGGIVDGEQFQIDDDPLFKVGEKYVLFLHEYATGHYMVVGGPTGRFAVGDSGAITPIVSDGVKFSGTLPALSQALETS
jgi:hypothetical protein